MDQYKRLTDKILKPGLAYPGKREEIKETGLPLLYQDGGDCSACGCFLDIYQETGGTYLVIFSDGAAEFTGDCYDKNIESVTLENIIDVLEFIVNHRCYDGNQSWYCLKLLNEYFFPNEQKPGMWAEPKYSFRELFEKNIDINKFINEIKLTENGRWTEIDLP